MIPILFVLALFISCQAPQASSTPKSHVNQPLQGTIDGKSFVAGEGYITIPTPGFMTLLDTKGELPGIMIFFSSQKFETQKPY